MPGITELTTLLRQQGWILAIASGGFTFFADVLKQRLSLAHAVANTLEIEDGALTGKLVGDIVDAEAKATTLNALCRQYDIKTEQTIAIGDGANDLAMMAVAGCGVAYHAKPLVSQQADCAIRHYGHTVLVHMLNHRDGKVG